VGRGCLGRPWLFGDLAAAFGGSSAGEVSTGSTRENFEPDLGFVADAFRRHAELLVEFFEDENRACRDIRKHVAWYFKGYPVGGELRAALAMSSSLQELDDHLAKLDRSQPYPGAEAEGQRGRAGAPKRPTLPYGWLDSRELQETDAADMRDGEVHNSGG
jgi:dihydrouridine synthase (Dus)